MGWFSKLIGDSAASPLKAIGDIVDDLHTSGEEKMDHELKLKQVSSKLQMLQMEITKEEAKHRSVFVAGWRPFIGWICGIGLALPFIINPIIQWITGEAGPELETEYLMELVVAMLGLSGLRTFEKLQGRTK